MQLSHAITWNRLDQHLGDLFMGERETALLSISRVRQQSRGHGLRDRELHRKLTACARGDEQGDFKLSPDDGGCRQDRLCTRGEACQALADQRRPTRGEPQLRDRAPFPANAAVPYRSVL